ncbi:MAG: cell division protein ZapA [Terriglobales bacterium]
MPAPTSTRVCIYDQSYAIGGGDSATIQRLADCVDAKMRQVAREAHVVDSLRVAVLAAVNIADENERLRAQVERLQQQLRERARALAADLDRLLGCAG